MHFHLIKITSSHSHPLYPPSIFLSSCLPVSFPSGRAEKCCRLESRFNRSRHQCHVSSPCSIFTASYPPPPPPLFIYIFVFKRHRGSVQPLPWGKRTIGVSIVRCPTYIWFLWRSFVLFGVLLLFWLLLLSILLLSERSCLHSKYCTKISRNVCMVSLDNTSF